VDKIYILADNIVSPLGFTTIENISQMQLGVSGIALHNKAEISKVPFYASLIDRQQLIERFSILANPEKYSVFEQLAIVSVQEALSQADIDIANKRTLFILCSTKGNVEFLNHTHNKSSSPEKAFLWRSAIVLKEFYNMQEMPVVISNACISGLLGIITGLRLIRSGHYDNAVITGADVISEFIYSGFSSFKSLSPGPCKPFDKTRDGLTLGEGAGTIIMGKKPGIKGDIIVGDGFVTNDANHISGPSRTAEGLYLAIRRSLMKAPAKPAFISAHGTATLYNDEMEALAITRAGLNNVPVNSFKGYWGHTLGAAGVVESAASVYSLNNSILIGTVGYKAPGVNQHVTVTSKTEKMELKSCLKIASGFGGCNAAIMFYK